MKLRRADGEFDYGGFAAICSLGVIIMGGLYGLAVRPLELQVMNNRLDIEANAQIARKIEITSARVDVIVTKQNETLTKLAIAVDKLADRIHLEVQSND